MTSEKLPRVPADSSPMHLITGDRVKEQASVEHKLKLEPITIYTYPLNPNVYKSLIAAKYGNVTNIETEGVEFGVTNKSDWFYKLNPLGKIPTLKTSDGHGVFESNVIARYIAAIGTDAEGLLGVTPLEQAKINQWTEVVTAYISDHAGPVWWFKIGYGSYNEAEWTKHFEALKAPFEGIERHFNNTGYAFLAGVRVTIADIILICTMVNGIKYGVYDLQFTKTYPKMTEYLKRVLEEKPVAEVLGEVQFAEKFDPTTIVKTF